MWAFLSWTATEWFAVDRPTEERASGQRGHRAPKLSYSSSAEDEHMATLLRSAHQHPVLTGTKGPCATCTGSWAMLTPREAIITPSGLLPDKWELVCAGMAGRTAENSTGQFAVSMAAMFIWSRYSLVIIEKNWSLFAGLFSVGSAGTSQLFHNWRHNWELETKSNL